MNLRRAIFTDHRNPFFIILSFATSSLALRPDSSLIPVILNLSVLATYSPFLFRPDESHRFLNVILTGLAVSVGGSIFRLQASLEALSSAAQSVTVLSLLSALLSAITLAALWAGTKFSTHLVSPWSQVAFFPTIWATLWVTVSHLSPVGHLSTWGVANNADTYNWIVPYLGPAGKNWIIGAWAVVLSQTVTSWYMGQELEDDFDESHTHNDNSIARKALAVSLILLTIPSFFIDPLPLPISQVNRATPLTVGCAIPPFHQYKHHTLTLDDYIAETNKLRSSGARIILWPEGAIVFHSATEKEEAFDKIRAKITGPYVGVSFEETTSDPNDPTGRKTLTRTGLAVVSQHFQQPHLVYYKRNLVPFAESYRLRSSTTPPSLFYAQVPNPGHGISSPEWAPNGTHTRPIPVSASICLDFANPSPFAELDARPGLILAPARTWDQTVGYAMWLQAKQRAEELGSMVLWCDGGEGGMSGVGGGRFNDVGQVGAGSFVRTIGVQYPFDDHQTIYGRFGGSPLILISWLSIIGPLFNSNLFEFIGSARRVRDFIRGLTSTPSPASPSQQNLIDV